MPLCRNVDDYLILNRFTIFFLNRSLEMNAAIGAQTLMDAISYKSLIKNSIPSTVTQRAYVGTQSSTSTSLKYT